MAVKVLLVILLLGLTLRQQGTWRDDVALWGQAVAVSPQSPRAAMNYAGAWFAAGQMTPTVVWLARAADLSDRHRDPENFERLIRLRVLSLEDQGVPACQDLSLSRFC